MRDTLGTQRRTTLLGLCFGAMLFAAANACAENYEVGQVWTYKTRPQEKTSTLQVLLVDNSSKMGPVIFVGLKDVRVMHPSGKMTRDDRLTAITGDDGITNCGNAQNCVRACPMSLPLTKAIYEENRETVLHGLFGWFRK